MADRYSNDRGGNSPKPRPRPKPRKSATARDGSAARSSDPQGSKKRAPRPSTSRRQPARREPARSTTRDRRPGRPRPNKSRRPRSGNRLLGVLKVITLFGFLGLLAIGVTGCAVYASMSSQLPDPDISKAKGRDQSTVIMDSTGRVLTRLYAEQNRQDMPLDKIPEDLRNAIIATEDKRFYDHEGVDPIGVVRGLVVDVLQGKRARGGSTITQQYVKQAFVGSDRTVKRKAQEAILAQRVERQFSKDEILELYLNTIYFGHGAYGVEAASRAYFGKEVTKITLAEAALITGVVKSPANYSPYLEPERALSRRNTVLLLMHEQGYIDQAAYQEAKDTPVELSGLRSAASTRSPYFVEWIKEQLVREYGETMVYRGGLRVRTTLDPAAQTAAEKAVQVLDREDDPSAAIVSIKPGNGAVVAMVGGKDFDTQQFNVAVQGKRQPGSAFKAFVLAAALQEGVFSEKSFESGASKFPVGDQTWSVTGASGGRSGPMRLRPATEQSVNSVFAALILDVGPKKVVETAEALGIRKGIDPVPAIALGGLTDGVSPLEMANAYATLAAGGKRAEPYGITEVKDPDGTVLFKAKPELTEAIDPAVAYIATDMLTGVITKGTGKAAQIGRPAAGKTGTTQKYRDAWFVGYTPELSTAVWVGHPDSQREMTSVHGRKVTGGSFPAEIWAAFMKAVLADSPASAFERPAGLSTVEVCAITGGKATPYCPDKVKALLLAGRSFDECELHQTPPEVELADLVGMTKAEALAAIEALHLKAKVVDKDVAGVSAGSVAEQKPKPGTKLKPDSVVTIVVGTGGGANRVPVAKFSASVGATLDEPVNFDASASTDDGRIVKYYWELGDGATAEGVKTSHVYSNPGTYYVTLWVTDDRGEQSSTTREVNVR